MLITKNRTIDGSALNAAPAIEVTAVPRSAASPIRNEVRISSSLLPSPESLSWLLNSLTMGM